MIQLFIFELLGSVSQKYQCNLIICLFFSFSSFSEKQEKCKIEFFFDLKRISTFLFSKIY
jgi:hypothetical protein